jgi:hypothetical protein
MSQVFFFNLSIPLRSRESKEDWAAETERVKKNFVISIEEVDANE